MFPPGRVALLAQSAGFEKVPEDMQIQHEMYATKYQKNIRKM